MDTQARERILAEARSWLGTPFHHKGRIKGVGVDCGGLIYSVFNACGYRLPPFPDDYAEDWSLHRANAAIYLDFIKPYTTPVSSPQPGDLMMVQYGRHMGHGTIYVGNGTVIHAWGRTQFGQVRYDSVRFFGNRPKMFFEVNP